MKRILFFSTVIFVLIFCGSCERWPETVAETTTASVPVKTNAESVSSSSLPAVNKIQENEPKSVVVYITDSGSKYHAGGCQYLKNSKHPVSLEQAKLDYSPCWVCKPEQ